MRGVDEQEDGHGGGLPLRAGPLQPREQGGRARDDTRHQGGGTAHAQYLYFLKLYSEAGSLVMYSFYINLQKLTFSFNYNFSLMDAYNIEGNNSNTDAAKDETKSSRLP